MTEPVVRSCTYGGRSGECGGTGRGRRNGTERGKGEEKGGGGGKGGCMKILEKNDDEK